MKTSVCQDGQASHVAYTDSTWLQMAILCQADLVHVDESFRLFLVGHENVQIPGSF